MDSINQSGSNQNNSAHSHRRYLPWGNWGWAHQNRNNQARSLLDFARPILQAVLRPFRKAPQHGTGESTDCDRSVNNNVGIGRSVLSGNGKGNPSPAVDQPRKPIMDFFTGLLKRPRVVLERSLNNKSSKSKLCKSTAAFRKFGSDGQVIKVDEFRPFGDHWPTKTGMTFSLYDDVLGMGSLGTVMRAKHCESSLDVAIKFVDRSKLKFRPYSSLCDWKQLKREITVQSNLNANRNVLSIKGAFFDSNFVFMILELATGDLYSEMKKLARRGEKGMAEKRVNRIGYGIACALRSCHESGFIHRDVKAQNVLLVGEGDCEVAKLGDFGLCVPMNSHGHYYGRTGGTLGYLGPEGLRRKPRVGSQIDWWAFGVLLFFLLFGEMPYPICVNLSVYLQPVEFPSPVRRGKGVSRWAKHLVRGLLEPDVMKRFGAEQVLSHPWFRKIAGQGHSE